MLIPSTYEAKKGLHQLDDLLDDSGFLPESISASEIKRRMGKQEKDNLAICINIAKCLYAIISEPIFDENAELTAKAKSLLADGDKALEKIKSIEGSR